MPNKHTGLTKYTFINGNRLQLWTASPRGKWLAVVHTLLHKLRTDLTERQLRGAIVVFDIDDTLVYGTRDTLITPVATLFEQLVRAGANVHVLTARPVSMRDETMRMLTKHNLKGYKDLHMMTNSMYESALTDPMLSAIFKTVERIKILDLYKGQQEIITASIGDMLWDVAVYPYHPFVEDHLKDHKAGAYIRWPQGELSVLLPPRPA